jgi:integrase
VARRTPGVTPRKNSDGTTTYEIRFRYPPGRKGRRYSHTFTRQAAAVEALRRIQLAGGRCDCPQHSQPAPGPSPAGTPLHEAAHATPTFGQALAEHAEHLTGVGADYRRRYVRDLSRHFAPFLGRRLEEVTATDVKAWLRGCEEGSHPWLARRVPGTRFDYVATPLSPVTVRRLLVQAGAIYRERGISPNPFAGHRVGRRDVDKHEAMKVLTPAEWALIRDALLAGMPRDFCTVLVTTGLRFGEASALQVGDVDLFASELRVRRAWKAGGEVGPPKSARSRRTVDFGPATFDALAPHCAGKEPGEWVFTAPGGGPIHPSNFHHRQWAPALGRAQAAGLARRPRLHDLRHTAVSWMLNAGVPIFEVSRRVGHESTTTTTDRYGHLLPKGSGAAVAAIEAAVTGSR